VHLGDAAEIALRRAMRRRQRPPGEAFDRASSDAWTCDLASAPEPCDAGERRKRRA
jgi:hypothetical protein